MIFNLGIALPLTNDKEYSQFWDSFHLMDKGDHVYIRPEFPGPADIVRNELVKKAFEAGCTHILMIDTDQVYPHDTITKMHMLFENENAKVVSAIVHRRYEPFDPLVFQIVRDINGVLRIMRMTDEEMFEPKVIRVGATGFGCIMFDMEIFNMISAPWFVDESYLSCRIPKGEENIGSSKQTAGEDIGFCFKLYEKGIQIFVDTTIMIDHLSLLAVNRGLYRFYKTINKNSKEKGDLK